jgi:hypothetical protein
MARRAASREDGGKQMKIFSRPDAQEVELKGATMNTKPTKGVCIKCGGRQDPDDVHTPMTPLDDLCDPNYDADKPIWVHQHCLELYYEECREVECREAL